VASSHTGAEATTSSQHRRRTSRGLHAPPSDGLRQTSLQYGGDNTPFHESDEPDYHDNDDHLHRRHQQHMSLDRSPSRERGGGGWSSPGLTTPYDDSNGRARSPANRKYADSNGGGGMSNGGSAHGVTWATAKANSERVNGYPSYQSQNQGFFGRHYRQLSQGLPYFMHGGQEDRYAEKEKLGRGRSAGGRGGSGWADLPRRLALLISRRRKYVALVLILLLAVLSWFHKRE